MPAPSWSVLVADDEPAARDGVRQLLKPFPEFTIIGECRNGREVLVAIDSLNPDVLFLDILMPEMNGFEVIRRRSPEKMPAIVFLTAFDKFALSAFDAEAHDYLVKPVSEKRFAATVRRLKQRLSQGPYRKEPSIVVATSRGFVVLPLCDIDWVEAADYYARVWTRGRSYLLRESLAALEPKLSPHGFVRAHRRALVRISDVRELRSDSRGHLVATLVNGATVPVSRRRRPAFLAAIRAGG